MNLQTVSDLVGISGERIRQILKAEGADYGTILKRRRNRERAYQEARRAAREMFSTTLRDGKRRPEYDVYVNMLRRCFDESHPNYARYGGRGITVCDRWLGKFGFEMFLRDMGARPAGRNGRRAMYSIQRIDNDGNYEPGNCKWATQKEQCENRRKPMRKQKQPKAQAGNTQPSEQVATN